MTQQHHKTHPDDKLRHLSFLSETQQCQLGVLIDLKKINQPTKPVSNLFWSRRNTYAVQANATA